MSAKDIGKELEIESITDITVLRKLRGPRKGQLTKLEKDLTRYRDAPLGELKRVTLKAMVSNLDKQLQFYLLIQDRILHLMQDEEAEELTKEEEKEEQERDTQHCAATAVRERLYDLISTADTMAKVKRVYRRLEGFQKSDSLRDSDILDKLRRSTPSLTRFWRPRRLYQILMSFMSKSRRLSFCNERSAPGKTGSCHSGQSCSGCQACH